ncbi:MAG: radical SAM family heme chaperone HemW [Flavobacteriales bacterium]|nr:radical SAM family heme chaperone HemW [Flavobacteriales bacterium]
MAGIYIHIPFCKKACTYCDFHFSTSLKRKADFVDALIQEIDLRKSVFSDERISSIYFGGGTPSLLSDGELSLVFEKLYDSFTIDTEAEITLEANPDDLTAEKIAILKASPINRLSIGVQSFRDEDLHFMQRAHGSAEAHKCIILAQEAGFNNISIDLIYGTPGMTDEAWIQNLQICFELHVPHVSSYALTVEEKTLLHQQIKSKKLAPLSEEQSARQFELLMREMSDNGYEQYEISNFCKSNAYSRHNSSYWKKENYLGLGPSAHSFLGNTRLWNVSNNLKYIKSLSKGELPLEAEKLSQVDRYNEYIMTSLRTKWGCNIQHLHTDYSKGLVTYFKQQIRAHITDGNIIENKGIYTLSDSGKLLADRISADLFSLD